MRRVALYLAATVGAALSLLHVTTPAFSVEEVGFIDPGDINPDGTLSDSTPDDQEWARQGGRIGLALSDGDLDVPVKRVLIPSIDARRVGSGDVNAHSEMITDVSVSGVSADDYILIGMNTVRQVDSITTTNGDTTITVDKAFGMGMSNATIYRINNSVTGLGPWDDNYSSYAMAEMISNPTYRASGNVSRFNAQHAIVDSDVGKGASNPLARISGSPTGTINTSDLLVVKVAGRNETSITVADVSGHKIEMEDVPGATPSNPLGLAPGETAYLVYWTEERNETGSVVSVRSQAHQDPVTAVLIETTPTSGEFVLEIMAVAPQDANGDDVMPDFGAAVPTLPVNPRDVVTLTGEYSAATLAVETTSPVISSLSPAHNTVTRDLNPEITALVTDADSGIADEGFYVIVKVTEILGVYVSGNAVIERVYEFRPWLDGDVNEVPGGSEIVQRVYRDYPGGDAVIEWWVMVWDNAGNVAYADSQPSIGGVLDPCMVDGDAFLDVPADYGCQPFRIVVDVVGPSLSIASTDVRVRIDSPIPVTVTFDGPVSGFTVDDISVANGIAVDFVGRDGDLVYYFNVIPTDIGEVTVDIPAHSAEDTEGNSTPAAAGLSLDVPYDDDHDGTISRAEVINAITDYLFGSLLARDQVIELIQIYLFYQRR